MPNFGNLLAGNFNGRFAYRRLFRRPEFDRSAYAYDSQHSLLGRQGRGVAARWASVIYGLNFGESRPGMGGLAFSDFGGVGWQIIRSTDDVDPTVDQVHFDAVTFRSTVTGEVVVAIEGSTTTGDWLDNFAVGAGSTGHFDAALSEAQRIVADLQSDGYYSGNVLITGQSRGALTVPIIAAYLKAQGYTVEAHQFSAPQLGAQVTDFLRANYDQFGWTEAGADDGIAQIESSIRNFSFANDAILATGALGGQRFGQGNDHDVIGPQLLFEETVIDDGIATTRLRGDGVKAHSAALIGFVLDQLGVVPSGGYFVVDQYGRGYYLATNDPNAPDISEITEIAPGPAGEFIQGDFSGTYGLYVQANLPSDARIVDFNSYANGTTLIDYKTGDGIRRLLTMKEDASGNLLVVEEILLNGERAEVHVRMNGEELSAGEAQEAMDSMLSNAVEYAGLMATMGSSLGAYLGGENRISSTVSSALLGTIGLNIGQSLTSVNVHGDRVLAGATDDAFSNFGSEFLSQMRSAAAGTISSMLMMDLGEALGLEGFGAELVNTVGTSVFSRVVDNVIGFTNPFAGLSTEAAFGDVASVTTGGQVSWNSGFVLTAIGSFLGSKLGSMVVTPETEAAVALSSVGSATGAFVFSGAGASVSGQIGVFAANLSSSLGQIGNVIVPGLGAFIGFVVGALLGNLFGSKKPKIPTADAETTLSYSTGYYQVGAVSSQNGGNEDLVRDMSKAARDTLNGIIGLITNGSEVAGNANYSSPTQVYGHTAGDLWVKLGSSSSPKVYRDSADQAVEYGVMWALKQTKVVGGDIFMKRAIFNTLSGSVMALSGEFQIAEDYALYLQQSDVIDAAISNPYRNLTQAQRSFYDNNSALVARVMAAPRDGNGDLINSSGVMYDDGSSLVLDATDEFAYRANRSIVDAIVELSELGQFAAGWIITLQRAAELGLNQTSRSDFYGGLGGLVDSLQIMAPGEFYQEDVQLSLDGTTLNVDYGRWSGDAGDNLMRGGDLSLGTDLLANEHNYAGAEGSETIETIDGQRALVFRDSGFYEAASGTLYASRYIAAGGDVDDGKRFRVNGGEYISWAFESKQLGDSRNRLYLNVSFFDSNGVHISNSGLSGAKSASWKRSEKAVVAPSAAAFAELRFYVYGRAGDPGGVVPAEAHVAARNIQFNRSRTPLDNGIAAYSAPVYERWTAEEIYARGGFTAMSNTARSSVSTAAQSALLGQASLYIGASGDLMSAEYSLISQTGADASSGNDIHIHSGSHGVTIDDLSSETGLLTFRYFDRSNPFEPNIVEGVVSDTFTWSGGDDIFVGGSGNDTIRGRDGYDWLSGGDGDDVIYGGAQDDVILGGGGDDRLYGEAGDDYISLGSGKDYGRDVNGVWVTYGAWGGAGNDTLVAGSGQAMIFGEDGDDTIILHQAPDGNPLWSRFEGGYGSDTISYERFINGVTIDMTTPYGVDPSNQAWFTLMGDQHFRSIENVTGSEHDDTLIGDALGNTLRGLGGDDILRGGDGEDILEGGAGADQLFGENGHDTASYDGSNSAVWIDFVNYEYFGGHAEGDTLDSIGRVIGSDFADTFFDRGGWNTRFWGGRGDDWFVASSGNGTTDYYYGDEDFDTVDYADVTSAININLGANIHSGGAANNRLYDIEQIVGSDFNDVILMDAKDNYIQGGKGNDTLYGGSGLDTYIYNFGDGRDVIHETEVGGGYDTLVLLGMNWADINLYSTDGGGGRQGAFNIDMADGGQVSLYRNQYHWENIEAGVDALDVGGVGAVDIGRLMAGAAGGNGNDTVIGRNDRADFIRGFAGNDTMYAAGSSTATEQDGNLIWGGRGNDSIWASVGDDEYIFEYGDGVDTIRDSGGDDRIQFGPSVAADDVIYEVVGNDLYIGLRDYSDPDLTASQVADRMRIINANSSPTSRIEYLTAGGVDIDLNKLDIFTSSSSGGGSGGGGTGGGGTGGGGTGGGDDPIIFPPGGGILPPVVFDLDGDGLELVGLNESRVVFQSDSGGPLMRLGWIGADEGILALDRDGNGLIDRTDEISFKGDYQGATTDLEGMRGFDTNGDGVFSAEDDRWSEFKIWQDLNQNGLGSANEYMSLDEAGFTAIDLTLTASGHSTDNVGDSTYTNTAVATLTDGSSLTAFDVALRFGLARATGSALPDASIWEGFDLAAAGSMGIAYNADGDAVDLVSSWDMASAGPDGANWIDLSLHQDIFDELEGPQAPAANPDDPVTESFGVKPIVIDLDGDGLDLINPAQSPLQLDANGDGALDRLGWVGSGDGFLALDRNGSGTIDGISEISFVQDLAGAQTDLEGLRAFDSNGDGWLSGADARFADFSVWVDSDFNALGTAEEMMTLGEAGIEAIALDHIEGTGGQEHGLANRLFGEAEIVWADGFSGGTAGDVELRAFRGFIDEQVIDERNRLLAQERSTDGAFAFDRHARRAAMEDMAREAAAPIADSAGNAPLGGGLGANMAGAGPEGVMSNNLGLVGDMLASDPRKRPVMEPGEAVGRLTAALQAESADRPQSGLGNAGFGSRWWADGDVAQAGAAGRTLADRLAALDQERQALGEPQGAGGGLPASEGLAEKQRLLQAIAAFRGSSGVATLRRGDEVATGQHDLFSSRRSLTQRSEGNNGSFFS